jgi:hypothetical protein
MAASSSFFGSIRLPLLPAHDVPEIAGGLRRCPPQATAA